MKQKTAGGEKSLAESPDEKAGVSVKLGSSRKKREKNRPRQFPAEIPVGIRSIFF